MIVQANMSDIRVNICRYLPEELQDIVWRKYVQTHLVEDANSTLCVRRLDIDKYSSMCTKVTVHVKDCVIQMNHLWSSNPVYFGVLMDTIEDRILEDIMSEDNAIMYDVFTTIRKFIDHPSSVVRELLHCPVRANWMSCSSEILRIHHTMNHVGTIHNMMFPHLDVEDID
jgi:hypothetical protein